MGSGPLLVHGEHREAIRRRPIKNQHPALLRWAKSRKHACSALVLDSNWPISSRVSNAEATNNEPPIGLSSLTS